MCPLVLNFVADSVIDIFFACGHFQISSNQIWRDEVHAAMNNRTTDRCKQDDLNA